MSEPFPIPYLSTEVSDRLTQLILDAFNHEHLTPHQARLVLHRVRDLVDTCALVDRLRPH